MEIKLVNDVGTFAENKDIARDIRLSRLIPALDKGELITLDFEGIEGATQSFIHALISDLFRIYSASVLDQIEFKNCSESVQKIVLIVSDYMQIT